MDAEASLLRRRSRRRAALYLARARAIAERVSLAREEDLRLRALAELAERTLALAPRPPQLAAALALHAGEAVELPTGEGKSLALALAACLHGPVPGGVHLAVPNAYLAARDAAAHAPLYAAAGLRLGLRLPDQSLAERRAAYAADVVVAPARLLAFDQLRDGLARRPLERVQRGFGVALVDELDATLVDDALQPLVLSGSGPSAGSVDPALQRIAADIVADLRSDTEVELREEGPQLTPAGERRAEQRLRAAGWLGEHALPGAEAADARRALSLALDAHHRLRRDEHYRVEGAQVVLLDGATGRRAPERRFALGMHAAIEAKERLPQRARPERLAVGSYRAHFTRYDTLAGTSATLEEVAPYLQEAYGLPLLVLPPARPLARQDEADVVHGDGRSQRAALVEGARQAHAAGRPVLLGAPTEAEARARSRALAAADVPHQTLTAADEADEARRVAEAGMPSAVTVATRLAGRGTDIRLGGGDPVRAAEVAARGGLLVLGAGRREDPRLERQLRGRAGRQGEAGTTRFHVSPDDAVLRAVLGPDERRQVAREAQQAPREARRRLDRAQATLAAQRRDALALRTRLDRVVEEQRAVVERWRRTMLEAWHPEVREPLPVLRGLVDLSLPRVVEGTASGRGCSARLERVYGVHVAPERAAALGLEALAEAVALGLTALRRSWSDAAEACIADAGAPDPEARVARLAEVFPERVARAAEPERALEVALRRRFRAFTPRRTLRAFRALMLTHLDGCWRIQLESLDALRDGLGWRGLLRGDPLQAFRRDAFVAFEAMRRDVRRKTLAAFFALRDLDRPCVEGLEGRPRASPSRFPT
ncbi:MAG: hypothetical protein AAF447_04280 [Myxococcota bacterium]